MPMSVRVIVVSDAPPKTHTLCQIYDILLEWKFKASILLDIYRLDSFRWQFSRCNRIHHSLTEEPLPLLTEEPRPLLTEEPRALLTEEPRALLGVEEQAADVEDAHRPVGTAVTQLRVAHQLRRVQQPDVTVEPCKQTGACSEYVIGGGEAGGGGEGGGGGHVGGGILTKDNTW